MLPIRASRRFLGTLSLALAFTAFPLSSHADTFTVYDVADSSGSVLNVGLTTSGSLVVTRGGGSVYTTFTPPGTFVDSPTAPALTYDNGSSCVVANAGAFSSIVGSGVCNNGYEVFRAFVGSNPYPELFDGQDPIANLVYPSNGDLILLNSVGDVAFVSLNNPNSRLDDSNLLLIRSATPEPNSLVLLGTGLLGAVGMMRRRLTA